MVNSVVAPAVTYISEVYAKLAAWLFEDKHALHGTALARILTGITVLGILGTNFRVRELMFGQGSVWNKPMYDLSQYAPPRITENMSNTVFGYYYIAVMVLAALFVLGWHTRLVGTLMLIGHVSLIERIPLMGDQGDNILRIGIMLLLVMHTSEFWSLDARRRARTVRVGKRPGRGLANIGATAKNLWNSQFVLPRWLSNPIHNIALAMLGFQLILIYISAGMFKVQGALWQHGTAIYYPMQLQEYKPFPFLSDLLNHYGIMVGVATYVVVFTQLFFPLMLLRVTTRRIAISLVILFHVSIAVLMALPWFSLSMIAFDAIWVSTSTLIFLEKRVRNFFAPVGDWFFDIADPVIDRFRTPVNS